MDRKSLEPDKAVSAGVSEERRLFRIAFADFATIVGCGGDSCDWWISPFPGSAKNVRALQSLPTEATHDLQSFSLKQSSPIDVGHVAFDGFDVPVLVIRGQQSDLLLEAVLKDMKRRNRNVGVHTIPDCGHAPALIADDQIEIVTKFLSGNDPDAKSQAS